MEHHVAGQHRGHAGDWLAPFGDGCDEVAVLELDAVQPARAWMAANTPDVVVLVFNDHANAFSLERVPTFALGMYRGRARLCSPMGTCTPEVPVRAARWALALQKCPYMQFGG